MHKFAINFPCKLGELRYDSKEELEACILNGIIPYVGFKDDKGERFLTLDYGKKDITEKMRSSKDPKDISACLQAGVLPSCYENTNISVEVRSEGQRGCFQRSLDQKTVVCPMGFTLRRTRIKGDGMVYASKPACRQCSNRCTPSKSHKTVYFGPKAKDVAVRMYGEAPPLNIPPPDFTPHNSFFVKNRIEKTVLIRIRDDIPKQKARLCISEHPFGTVKWYHGAHYLLCRGIKKATAEPGAQLSGLQFEKSDQSEGYGSYPGGNQGLRASIFLFFHRRNNKRTLNFQPFSVLVLSFQTLSGASGDTAFFQKTQ